MSILLVRAWATVFGFAEMLVTEQRCAVKAADTGTARQGVGKDAKEAGRLSC